MNDVSFVCGRVALFKSEGLTFLVVDILSQVSDR